MDKLKMHSKDKTQENFEVLQKLFPNAVTETITGYDEDGKAIVERAIDKDILQQEINATVVEGKDERYQFTWPDKKRAIISANAPINKTLRPCREESVDFDNTENLYIEGDNLEVLKLLQETYLGKIKMIYIDPPYNTGHDFVYNDKFSVSPDEWDEMSGELDEYGNRLTQNNESNGRFHTDWLNMIYPRLKIARDLLTDDGVIFISINDKEINSLKDICSEIFGFNNFLATLIWDKNHSAQAGIFKVYHEYVLVYAKNVNNVSIPKSTNHELFEAGAMKKVSGRHPASEFTFPAGTRFDAPDGTIIEGEYGATERVIITKGRIIAKNNKLAEDVTLKAGFTQANQMKQFFYGNRETLMDSQGQKIVEFYLNSSGKVKVIKERSVESPQTTCRYGTQGAASNELATLFQMEECPFSSPKPVGMIEDFIRRFVNDNDIVLDFFSGSATTAHAVMKVNLSTELKKIKYILVQLAEDLDKSLIYAQKDAIRTIEIGIELLNTLGKPHNICEIGKERIRRAAELEKKNVYATAGSSLKWNEERKAELGEDYVCPEDVDIGFRVLKLDESNMKDVYYNPTDFNRSLLDTTIDNIKEDRTPEDLLFQVMLDLGVFLSSKIEETDIAGKKVFNVANGYLMACFDSDVNDETITAVAKQKPLYFVMRDSSLSTDTTATNFDQIFETYSPDTVRKVI